MTTELITFNHLSCHSSSTALGTGVIIENYYIEMEMKEKLKGKRYPMVDLLLSTTFLPIKFL
jgi:hypothetical protein